jgi:carboxymethylenebutenolidase
MCDNDAFDDMLDYELRKGVSRRQFGAIALGAGFVSMLPQIANAMDTKDAEVEIKTPDGVCDAYFVHPAKGKYPGVLIWPDIFGLRPAFKQMAKRLAESGYSVLVINPFYRIKKAPTSEPNADFNDPETRKALSAMSSTMNAATALVDSAAFVGFLDAQPSVNKKKKVGTTG